MNRKRHFVDFAPFLILLASLVLSVILYFSTDNAIKREVSSSFNATVSEMSVAVVLRMRTYEQVLTGGESLFEANDYKVSRKQWITYARGLRLEERFPGIQAVGFAKYLTQDQIEPYEKLMQAEGLAGFSIHPRKPKDHYVVVSYMYPESTENLRVMGFDLSGEPVRSAMLDYSGESGNTGVSGRIQLKQDITGEAPAGFLMALPIYKDDNLYGYISAPFRMRDLMSGIFGNAVKGISVRIYDGSVKKENMLFSSAPLSVNHTGYSAQVNRYIYGRKWIMVFDATPDFLSQFDFNKPIIIMFSIIITGTLLAVLVFIILRTRTKAYEIAEHMTQKLYESESRYKKTYEQAPTGILMTTPEMRVFKANKRFCEISGYELKKLVNLPMAALLEEKDFIGLVEHVEKLIQKQTEVYETERRMITKNHDTVWIDLTVSVYFDKNDKPLYLIFIIEDITRRKKAEEGIISLSMRQAAILDNSLVGIMQTRGRVIEWVNSALETLSGYTADEMIGSPTRMLYQSEEQYNTLHRDVTEGGAIDVSGFLRFQGQLKKKDGSLAWVDVAGKRVSNETGAAAIWVISDISERINAENELMLLNSTLETKVVEETQKRIEQERIFMQQGRLAAMGEMIGAIAHQWRQPLNIISIMVQNANDEFLDGSATKESMQEFTSMTLEQVAYMSETIDDFRNFFRKDTQAEKFSPVEHINSVIKLIKSQLANNNISVSFDYDCDPQIMGQPNEFSHVILNLMNNSKDAAISNRIQDAFIRIRMSLDSDSLTIRVEDNAGGISKDIQDRIFDPYFTTKGPDKGTGIGLYVSKLIIDDHFNGKLSFRNTDSGAEFIIVVPANEAEKTADRA